MIRGEELISERVGTARRRVRRDRTGAHYFPRAKLRIEAGKPPTPAAVETNATIALPIGDRRRHSTSGVIGSRASISSHRPSLLRINRKAEGAHHVAAARALLVDGANILIARRAGVTKLETDAIASPDIAFAIRDLIVDETVRLRAKRVLLILANRERRSGRERRIRGEG